MRTLAPILAAVTLVVACTSSDETGSAGTTTEPAISTSAPAEAFVYPGEEWERADAAEMGFDPAALEAVAATAEELDSSCFVVTRKGKVVGEWYWDGTEPTTTSEVFSVTKSITSTLVGLAQADGALAIEDPASDYIEEWVGTDSEVVTIEHLLSNDSGREWSFGLDYVELPRAADRTQFAIDLGQQYPPGEAWSYNNAAIQTLDRVISVATGEVTADYARERLFEPIGMDATEMAPGNADGTATSAFFGLQSTCEDLARFGYLFLRDGTWEGEEVVPAAWVDEATGAPSQEHNAAYGYLWWLNTEGRILGPLQAVSPTAEPEEVVGQIAPGAPEDMFTAQGLGGQIVMVDPGSETVIVRLGSGPAGDPQSGFRAPDAARVLTEALVDP
ncbi:beta-lactamase family protein [Iamia sp. SCSIO 61187]|uniref:serine hydrolase domain-containing protein n=1 Tax=Iamia sp. SCSIO 61187 TaxID=2722752 RepID=UPI001C635168|nr:serine hydrolase domain-containing protein [Iamia sp. SCSIO 61187]QYG95116.1 beta-lactamase family protein [Iamia sp. SCSIO 61187]